MDMQYNYLHPSLQLHAMSQLELDIYIPSLSLAFEYQGIQHYQQVRFGLNKASELDEEKRRLCKEAKITLIEVPYWWDMTKRSLIEYINTKRPGLLVLEENKT